MEVGCVIFLILMVLAAIALGNAAKMAQQAKDKAQAAYRESLAQLKLV